MSIINEHIVKEKILEEVQELLISWKESDRIYEIDFPEILDELSEKLDEILKNANS